MGQNIRAWILALLFGCAGTSVHALTYGDAEFTCPIGGEVFTSQVVGSYSRFGTRLDLKPLGALVAPLPIPVCPGNGFVMYKETFSKEELAKLTSIVESDAYRDARKQHTDHYMAAFLLEKMAPVALDLAHVYLKASWEAEEKRPDRLAEYQALSLARFKTYLESDPKRDDSWWIAQSAAASLERRTGLHSEAIARIDALPLEESEAREKYAAFVAQIRQWAEKQDTSPQKFEPQQ